MDGWIVIGGVLGAQLDLWKCSPLPLPTSLTLCCRVSNKAMTYEGLTFVTYCVFFPFSLTWSDCALVMWDTFDCIILIDNDDSVALAIHLHRQII